MQKCLQKLLRRKSNKYVQYSFNSKNIAFILLTIFIHYSIVEIINKYVNSIQYIMKRIDCNMKHY